MALAQARASIRAREPAPAFSAGSGIDDQLIQIEKLSSLKEQGLLTDEECSARKAQILGI